MRTNKITVDVELHEYPGPAGPVYDCWCTLKEHDGDWDVKGGRSIFPQIAIEQAFEVAAARWTHKLAKGLKDDPWTVPITRRHMVRGDGAPSSNIDEIGYNWATHTVEVLFQPGKKNPTGSVYRYLNVPWRVMGEWLRADSPGHFFGVNIRNGGYEYRRID